MTSRDQAVRDAAVTLKTAIEEAEAAGYRVYWPGAAADLDHIAVSETAKVVKVEEPTVSRPSTFKRPVVE